MEQQTTVIATTALAINARSLELNVDAIMFAVKVLNASLAVVERLLGKETSFPGARKIEIARKECVVPRVMESLCASLC